jgi:hypothetical protein
MGRITPLLTVAVASLLAACHSYRPQPLPAIAAGRSVRVQFSMPRTLVAARSARSDSVLKLVSTFEGRLVAVSGDTMKISLRRITDAAPDHEAPPGMTVTVVPDPSVAIDVLELDAAKTTALIGIPIWVITTVAAVFAFAVLLKYLEN